MNAFKHMCIISICFLSSCAPPKLNPEFQAVQPPLPSTPEQPLTKKTNRQANTLSTWEISGAMAARNTNKGWTASLNWLEQGPNQYQIRLFGPLGGGTVLIEKKGDVITYTDGPKKVSSRNADQLLQQQTGVRLPVHNLYYWVRGLPAPGAIQSSKYDQNAHLLSLMQDGYTINYTNYTSVSNIDLPGKIQLQGHGVSIKLVIKRWSI